MNMAELPIIEVMNSEILIYQNQDGNIKIDVRLQEETEKGKFTEAKLAKYEVNPPYRFTFNSPDSPFSSTTPMSLP